MIDVTKLETDDPSGAGIEEDVLLASMKENNVFESSCNAKILAQVVATEPNQFKVTALYNHQLQEIDHLCINQHIARLYPGAIVN
ncbi:MAG: hypothetical protein WCG98_00940 [bacterium]